MDPYTISKLAMEREMQIRRDVELASKIREGRVVVFYDKSLIERARKFLRESIKLPSFSLPLRRQPQPEAPQCE
jgi:hypothetical protein